MHFHMSDSMDNLTFIDLTFGGCIYARRGNRIDGLNLHYVITIVLFFKELIKWNSIGLPLKMPKTECDCLDHWTIQGELGPYIKSFDQFESFNR